MTMKFRYMILVFGLLLASLSPRQREARAEEPHYQGRSLTSWLDDFAYGRYPDMDRHNAAVKAVREIGADAIPTLMERIQTTSEDHALLLRNERERGAQRVQDSHTVSAIRALGSVFHAKIPTLIVLLAPKYDAASESSSDPDYWLKYRSSGLAGSVLSAMGSAAADPLLEAIVADDPKIRFGVIGVLESIYRRSKDERIVPAILERLHDEDVQVRWISARVLGSINTDAETCVPALADRVREDPAENVRAYALMALKKFGPRAQAALPDVKAAMSDENSAIRYYARETLKAIQVEAAP